MTRVGLLGGDLLTCLTVEPPYRVVFTWGIPGNDALPPGALLTAPADPHGVAA
ncbi:hypothetical protein ACFY03_07685 [Micromonospora chersina]|uniref:hypothetical protein n=1 Tax=Micromonospora chersina TaxID=47854 RepID=UPI0036C0975B